MSPEARLASHPWQRPLQRKNAARLTSLEKHRPITQPFLFSEALPPLRTAEARALDCCHEYGLLTVSSPGSPAFLIGGKALRLLRRDGDGCGFEPVAEKDL